MIAVTNDLNQFSRVQSGEIQVRVPDVQTPDNTLSTITIPGPNQSLSKFAAEVGAVVGPKKIWFVKSNNVVEVRQKRLSDKINTTVFHPITATEMRTALEEHVSTGASCRREFVEQSISREVASALLEASQFKVHLPVLDRIMDVQKPFILDGQIVYPCKGYDERFNTYCPCGAPDIDPMTLAEAKALLLEVHRDFCLADELSVTLALARMLTPFCRGLMGYDSRTPVWIFEANRPRSGKDYLAGCTSIIYEGHSNEDAPLDHAAEETWKRIVAALQSGRRFMHFANCEGYMRNSALEHAATAVVVGGRRLGSNDAASDLRLANEIEFSLSANTGFQYSEDLNLRARKISLTFFEENANARTFSNSDLHGWIKENRSRLLGAMAALVAEWDRKGRPNGTTPFTSFPAWARTVGGIMVACGLGDPCISQPGPGLTGDDLTENMKQMFEAARDQYGERELSKPDLLRVVEDQSLFPSFDLNNKSHQTAFGLKLKAFENRVLGGIQMVVNRQDPKRPKYRFTQPVAQRNQNLVAQVLAEDHQMSTLGTLGTSTTQRTVEVLTYSRATEVDKVDEVPILSVQGADNPLLGRSEAYGVSPSRPPIPLPPTVTQSQGYDPKESYLDSSTLTEAGTVIA